MEKPLVNKSYLLEKFPGKGGWTYAAIPEVLQSKDTAFGWVKVKGTIDGFEINKYNLAPMGNGQLFLPVRAEIRKKIKKEAGDYVHVILYADNEPAQVPDELLACIKDDPEAFRFFESLADNEKQHYVKWIYEVKTDDVKVERIAKALDRLASRRKFFDR